MKIDTFPLDDLNSDHIPEVFELQIKTVFQHAWSECAHDIEYKQNEPLTHDDLRKVAFTAAQTWGADNIFEELNQKYST